MSYKKYCDTKMISTPYNNISQHIDIIIYISSKKNCPKRYEHVKNITSRVGVQTQHYEAIYPQLQDIQSGKYAYLQERFTSRLFKYMRYTPKRLCGIIGCYLSHYNIHTQAMRESWGNYLIVEDDVYWTYANVAAPKWCAYLSHWFDGDIIPEDWDMFRCMTDNLVPWSGIYTFDTPNMQSKWAPDKITAVNSNCISSGSHFQLCNGSSAEKIVKYFDSENVYNVDSIYSTNQLNVYFSGLLIRTNGFPTTIPK